MKIYFLRHGESDANLLREFSNRGVKHPLTEAGRRQAHVLADALRGAGITRLYSSPLLRAVQTAEILGAEWQVPWETSGALREFDCGVLEGRSDAAGWASYDALLSDWLLRGLHDRRLEEGESFDDMRARFIPFLEGLAAECQATDAGIVLVAHGGIYRCMLPLVLENIDPAFAMAHIITNTGAVVAEWRDGRLVCTDWCGEPVGFSAT